MLNLPACHLFTGSYPVSYTITAHFIYHVSYTITAHVHHRWPGARHKAHKFAGFQLFQISHKTAQRLLIEVLSVSIGGPRHIALVACDTAALAKDCLVFSPLDETLILPQIGERS